MSSVGQQTIIHLNEFIIRLIVKNNETRLLNHSNVHNLVYDLEYTLFVVTKERVRRTGFIQVFIFSFDLTEKAAKNSIINNKYLKKQLEL